MAEPTGLNMIAKILGQIYNLHELIRIGGDVYKLDKKDGKDRNKAGKTWTRPQLIEYVKGQQYTAPNVPKPNSKLKVKTTPKPTTNPLQVGREKLDTFTRNRMNERWLNNRTNNKNTNNQVKVGKDGLTRGTRATVNNMTPGRQGGGIATVIANSLLGETGFDVGGRIANILTNAVTDGPDYNLKERQAFNAKQMANRELRIQQNRAAKEAQRQNNNYLLANPDSEQTGGVIGRRPEQEIDRPKPTSKKVKPKDDVKISKTKEDKKEWTPPEGFFSNTEKKKSTKTKIKTEKKKDDSLKIHDKYPSAIQKKLIKAGFTKDDIETLVTNYNEKYRNNRGW